LSSALERRPVIVALAGPNGAGKSTFYDANLASIGLHFVNADVLAKSLRMDAYAAAALADSLRRQLVERRESFIFETVFSDPVGDKLKLLRDAEGLGYTVLLIFIGLADARLSDQRVAMRASTGGHDVPSAKLVERFPRVMQNLKRALSELSDVLVYDHSDVDVGYRLVASREGGKKIELVLPTPRWLQVLLPKA
jgi:predicted ABC-type ATPase